MSKSEKTGKKIAGMIRIAVVFLIIIGAVYLITHGKELYGNISGGQIRVACVGDSITYGEHMVNRSYDCYPAQLKRMLGYQWKVRNFGVSGSTVSDESKASYSKTEEYRKSLEYEPDIVVLMLGTNDTKEKNWKNKEFFQEQYDKLLRSYLSLASNPTIYLCTPASAYFPQDENEGIYAYGIRPDLLEEEISVIRETAQRFHLQVIDIHQITAEHRSWFQVDGIHPLKTGAQAIAEAVRDTLQKNTEVKEGK